jgi:hypothetical protein
MAIPKKVPKIPRDAYSDDVDHLVRAKPSTDSGGRRPLQEPVGQVAGGQSGSVVFGVFPFFESSFVSSFVES